MSGDRLRGAATALIGLMFLPAGIQAALFPRSFYDDFPLGRGWISQTGGPYNEHLVRDVGALFVALAIASIWAWWRPSLCRPIACAWLVQGALHVVFHLGHLDGLDGIDKVAMVSSLIAPLVLAVFVLALDVRVRRTSG